MREVGVTRKDAEKSLWPWICVVVDADLLFPCEKASPVFLADFSELTCVVLTGGLRHSTIHNDAGLAGLLLTLTW